MAVSCGKQWQKQCLKIYNEISKTATMKKSSKYLLYYCSFSALSEESCLGMVYNWYITGFEKQLYTDKTFVSGNIC